MSVDMKKLWRDEWVEHEGMKIIPPEKEGAEASSRRKEANKGHFKFTKEEK